MNTIMKEIKRICKFTKDNQCYEIVFTNHNNNLQLETGRRYENGSLEGVYNLTTESGVFGFMERILNKNEFKIECFNVEAEIDYSKDKPFNETRIS